MAEYESVKQLLRSKKVKEVEGVPWCDLGRELTVQLPLNEKFLVLSLAQHLALAPGTVLETALSKGLARMDSERRFKAKKAAK
jgi:hypothetical protein